MYNNDTENWVVKGCNKPNNGTSKTDRQIVKLWKGRKDWMRAFLGEKFTNLLKNNPTYTIDASKNI